MIHDVVQALKAQNYKRVQKLVDKLRCYDAEHASSFVSGLEAELGRQKIYNNEQPWFINDNQFRITDGTYSFEINSAYPDKPGNFVRFSTDARCGVDA